MANDGVDVSGDGSRKGGAVAQPDERWPERMADRPSAPGLARLAVIGGTGAALLVAGMLGISAAPGHALAVPWMALAAYALVGAVAVGGMMLTAGALRTPQRTDAASRPRRLPAPAAVPSDQCDHLDRFQVDTRTGRRIIEAEAVEWFEASGNYARLHVAEGSFLYRLPLSRLEALLDARHFLRVHRSAIVNLRAVREIVPLPSGDLDLTMLSGTRVRVSRRFARAFHDASGRGH